jgi:N-acetylglucosaminyldiphosphoundecaprenol N-acetyl-beta-D-mannosaminyltransferase
VIHRGKRSILGVGISVVDYEAAVRCIIDAAHEAKPFAVSALAVHGVMTGARDILHRYRLNRLDLVAPDGQPVRWALRFLHGERLRSRVYGPDLMLHVCAAAAKERLPIYLYGSRPEVLRALTESLQARFPEILIAGAAPSRFKRVTPNENAEIMKQIRASGARIVFVGLGCPRQEVWVYENRLNLSIPAVAVGAAFDFHAGVSKQSPVWMQDRGLEWLYRLLQEPQRLWRRYLLLNPLYCWYIFLQGSGLRNFRCDDDPKPERPLIYA